MRQYPTISIIVADDDDDDRLLIREAFEEGRVRNPLVFVENGRELLDALRGEGTYADKPPLIPALILLDLNMPVMDGREALREIKQDPKLRSIPVVALTTSSSETDVLITYNLGVNSYVTKPVTFDGMVNVIKELNHYWFEIVRVPNPEFTA